MNAVSILFSDKKYTIPYEVETFTIGTKTDSTIVNVYSVFIKEPSLIEIVKEHFTLIYDITQPGMDIKFNILHPLNHEEKLLKQCIAKAILKNVYP